MTDHWASDPDYPVADWRHEVANDDTRLGYHAWVAARKGQPDTPQLTRAMFRECQYALGDNAHRFTCDEMDSIVAAAKAVGIMYADELLDIHAQQDEPGDRHYQGPPPP